MQEIMQESYFNAQKSHIGLAQMMSLWEGIRDQNLATQLFMKEDGLFVPAFMSFSSHYFMAMLFFPIFPCPLCLLFSPVCLCVCGCVSSPWLFSLSAHLPIISSPHTCLPSSHHPCLTRATANPRWIIALLYLHEARLLFHQVS